jgi:hypothetical protein
MASHRLAFTGPSSCRCLRYESKSGHQALEGEKMYLSGYFQISQFLPYRLPTAGRVRMTKIGSLSHSSVMAN